MASAAQWGDDRVKKLLLILKERDVISQLDSVRRNDNIYKDLVNDLEKELGVKYTVAQIRSKVKAQKNAWKAVRDNNAVSGRDRKTCKFFEEMDELWGNRPTAKPPKVIDSGLNSCNKPKSRSLYPNKETSSATSNGNGNEYEVVSIEESNVFLYEEGSSNLDESLYDSVYDSGKTESELLQKVDKSKEFTSRNILMENEENTDYQEVPTGSEGSLGESSSKRPTRKRKLGKVETLAKDLMNQFESASSTQQKEFLEIQHRFELELFEKMMKVEEEREKRQQDHELKVLELLTRK